MRRKKRVRRVKGCNRHRRRKDRRQYDQKRLWLYSDLNEKCKEEDYVS
jgi:hypothetical protein